MELICVSNISNVGNKYINITVGNKYTLVESSIDKGKNIYWIVDDFGSTRGIDRTCFLTIENWRELQFSKIGL